jgi:hypothetical protein
MPEYHLKKEKVLYPFLFDTNQSESLFRQRANLYLCPHHLLPGENIRPYAKMDVTA